MKKTFYSAVPLAVMFCLGFAFKSFTSPAKEDKTLKRVTGLGGIFFKCKDPNKVREWYKTHLGLNTNKYGTVFEWRRGTDSSKKGFTQWSPFAETTKYFGVPGREFM